MKILVTNDDGIYAKGLWVLAAELRKVAEVIVVAPDREQSATSSAITLHQPLRLTQVRTQMAGIKAYSIEGTPADSVILALGILDDIGIVFSGINEGINLGDDVLLSGTVGAALQGYLRGLPSIALSVVAEEDMHFEVAARFASLLADKIINNFTSTEMLLNINLPNLPFDKVKGVEITKLAKTNYNNLIEEGHDGKRKCYWIMRGKTQWIMEEGTDTWAVEHGKISISPLKGEMGIAPENPFLQSLRSLPLQELQSNSLVIG